MTKRGTGRIGLGVALALASCLRASVPEFPTHLTTTLKLSERPVGPHGPAPFAVVAAGPRGEVGTLVDPGVTLVFNRPMRNLEPPKAPNSAQDQGAADPVSIEPPLPNVTLTTEQGHAVPGVFRWVGKRGLLFEPKGKLPGATRFEVRVAAGTAALDGSRLPQDYTLEFTTVRPALHSNQVQGGLTHARPGTPIFLQFTQRIAPEQLAQHLKLTRRVAESVNGQAVPFTVSAESPVGTKQSEVPLWLKVTPSQELPKASTFDLEITAGLVGSEGPLPTDKAAGFSFQTYGPLRVDNVLCARQSLGRCQAHRDFSVVTSTPVRSEELRKHITITGPKRPALPKAGSKLKPKDPEHTHPLGLDPDYGDVFQVRVGPDLTDTFGQRLGSEVKVELAIEAPFVLPAGAPKTPKSDARKRFDNRANDGDQPPPDVPRRPNLFQDLEFGVRGEVLEALAGVAGAGGRAQHKIPIGSINVPSYGLRSWASSELSTVHWLGHSTPTEHWVDPPAWSWITPQSVENERAVHLLDLDAALGPAGRGAAFIQAMALGEAQVRSQLLSVTDLGISARISRFGSTAWVTHLSTGAPVNGATVSVYDQAGKELASHTTDAAGLADFSSSELEPLDKHDQLVGSLVLVARSGEDWTFERVRQSSAVDVGTWVDSAQKADWAGLVFADRGVYRPGEVVRAGGYFRQTQARGFSVPKGQELEYTLRDVNGEPVAQGRSTLDRFGALSLRVELPKSAALGPAELSVRLGLNENERFSTSLQIMEFKPAEFKVGVDPVKSEVVHGTGADFVIHSEYLFGAPVADGHVDVYISRTPTRFTPPGSDDLVLDDDAFRRDLRSYYYNDTSYDQTSLGLDEQGKAEFHWDLDGDQPQSPINLLLEADVQDLTRQAQTGRDSVLVHPAEFYLGLKPLANRFLAIGAQATPSVIALAPDGKSVSGVPVKLELLRRTWTTATEDRAADSLYYQTGVHDEPAGECPLTSAVKPSGCALKLTEPGYYVIRASARDKLGNTVFASYALYAVDDRADSKPVVGWKEADRRGLKLEFDKQSYTPGETAKLLVKNPFSRATALVTVERGSILDRRVVELNGPMPVIEVPIKDDFFPNAFVSVHLLRGRTALAVPMDNANQADVGAPQFRVGYTQLSVDPNSRKLEVAITTPKKGYAPGEEVHASVQLRDTAGKPAAGSLTFYVVDEGVLMLTGYKTPQPLGAFSNARSLGVFPLESRDNLARIIALRAGERFAPRGWETPPREESEYDYGDKGYEGGDGDPGRPRSEFKTTVFFEAGRAVGEDGRADFRFKLPDNLTSFRLMAVAAGANDRFGSSEHSITSSRPLMARPLLPRALRVGDKFEAGVAVTSLGLPAGKAQVSFKPSGVTLRTANTVTLNLAASGQAEARFGVTVTKPGELGFEFAASHPQARDSVRVSRTATQPVRWLTAASYGVTKESVAIGLGELRAVRADLGELNVTVSSSALVGLDSVFQNLIDYPYGCTEQLASRVLPVLAAPELAAQQNITLPRGRIDWVDEAIGQIAGRQRYDGSFGYWENDDTAVPWLSAYALLALERASQQGYFVPRNVRNRTVTHLNETLSELLGQVKTERANAARDKAAGAHAEPSEKPVDQAQLGLREHSGKDLQLLRLAQATFIADALTAAGQPLKSQLYELGSFHDEMSISVRAQLVHAMAHARLPRQDTQPLLDEVLAETTIGPFEARVETSNEVLGEMFESPARTTAWVLRALIAVDSKSPVAPKLARGLVGFRQHDSYRNTQEDAWALIALEEYRQSRESQPPNFSAKVALGDELKAEFAFRGLPIHAESIKIPMADVLASEDKRVGLFAEGTGPMYYAVAMKAAKDGASSIAIDEGLSIDKRMRSVEPVDLDEAAGIIPRRTELVAGLGQLVVVDLLLESAEPRDQIVIDDPLPAGLEPVDFGFETTARALSTMNDEQARMLEKPVPKTARWGQMGQLSGVHREMRDDRVVLFLPAIDAGIYHLRYLARATTPGHFVMPPTRTSCMYDPEIYGQNAGAVYEVSRERDPKAKDSAAKGPVALLGSHL